MDDYRLSLEDIIKLTDTQNIKWFKTIEEGGNIFLITKEEDLENILNEHNEHNEHKNSGLLMFLLFFNDHWTILAIEKKKYFTAAFYIDSLGDRLYPNILEVLEKYHFDFIFSSFLKQQKDSVNCGLYAFLNIVSVFRVFNEFSYLKKDALTIRLKKIKSLDIGNVKKIYSYIFELKNKEIYRKYY